MTARRWPPAAVVTGAGIAGATLVYACLAWQHRWISDDGLIVVRTVRELLAGHGPVQNAFERVEADTCTLWTYLLACASALAPSRAAYIAVWLGGLLSVAGVAVTLDATRRFQRARGHTGVLVPAGICIVLGAIPFWDYATSGLETGLTTFWAALSWWLLVTLAPGCTRRRCLLTAIWFGLGPLVRPELAVAAPAFAAAGWMIVGPSRRRTVELALASIALPLAYEIFRAGYYGALVPLPALAKSASAAHWTRGIAYVLDTVLPYRLWLPLAVLLVVGVVAATRRTVARRDLIVAAAPLAGAAALSIFVVRVGGDFMHARMLLPPLFLATLPVAVLPLRPMTSPAIAALLGWALWTGIALDTHAPHVRSPDGFVEDEHVGYVRWTRRAHPIAPRWFVGAARPSSAEVRLAVREGRRVLVTEDGRVTVPLSPDRPGPVAYGYGRLGTAGATLPLDGIVVDTLGLANAIGARITVDNLGMPGHEKILPLAWQLADYAAAGVSVNGVNDTEVRAARHAMHCGALAELMASIREPLTLRRFWANLGGALARTRLVVPADPIEAEWKFCGAPPGAVRVITSSSYEGEGISREALIDGVRTQGPGAPGFSSHTGIFTDHAEWIELRFPRARPISQLVLYPDLHGDGYPVDFAVQVWEGSRWVDRVVRTGSPAYDTPQTYAWQPSDVTDRVRLVATHLRTVLGGYVIQLAEIEAR